MHSFLSSATTSYAGRYHTLKSDNHNNSNIDNRGSEFDPAAH
jgi:hypothetical protein